MASHIAYLPFVSSPVARKRYTSPTTAMVRPSAGFISTGTAGEFCKWDSICRSASLIAVFSSLSFARYCLVRSLVPGSSSASIFRVWLVRSPPSFLRSSLSTGSIRSSFVFDAAPPRELLAMICG